MLYKPYLSLLAAYQQVPPMEPHVHPRKRVKLIFKGNIQQSHTNMYRSKYAFGKHVCVCMWFYFSNKNQYGFFKGGGWANGKLPAPPKRNPII